MKSTTLYRLAIVGLLVLIYMSNRYKWVGVLSGDKLMLHKDKCYTTEEKNIGGGNSRHIYCK